jgi:sugar phosphate isomerase/epimerase
MHSVTRRHFLGAAGAALFTTQLSAIEPIQRRKPRIKGVGLAAYSMRDSMKFEKGKPGRGKMDLLEFLDYCADLRLDAAELTSYYFPEPVEKSYINELKRKAHLLGLDLSSAAMGNNFSYSPTSEQGKKELDYTRTWIDIFADLGIPVMRIFGGTTGKGTDPEKLYENTIANITEALAYAEKRGVILGLENHDRMQDFDELLRVVKAIKSRNFGVFLDSGNLRPSPDPYAQLARIAPYAVSVQVKVYVPFMEKKELTDFDKLMKTLHEGGYGGYVVLEYEEKEDPLVAIPKYIAQIRAAIRKLDDV